MTVRTCPHCLTELHTPLLEFEATGHMDDGLREQLCNWLTSIGVDPNNVKSGYVLQADAGYELHLTEFERGEGGGVIADVAYGQVIGAKTSDRVVELGPVADWPGAEVAGGDHPGNAPAGG